MKQAIALLFIIYLVMGCISSKSTLQVQKMPNFDRQAPDHILFLDFSIKQTTGQKTEATKLVNSVAGTGQMKDLGNEVHNPYQIKAVHYYNNGQKSVEVLFEHPLYRSVELFDADGSISRKPSSLQEGILSMRIQHSNSLEKIELYSITPDKGTQLIYALKIK